MRPSPVAGGSKWRARGHAGRDAASATGGAAPGREGHVPAGSALRLTPSPPVIARDILAQVGGLVRRPTAGSPMGRGLRAPETPGAGQSYIPGAPDSVDTPTERC